jgi:hypothetical protein
MDTKAWRPEDCVLKKREERRGVFVAVAGQNISRSPGEKVKPTVKNNGEIHVLHVL